MTTSRMGDADVRLFMAASDSDLPLYVGAWAEVRTEAGSRLYRTMSGSGPGWGFWAGTVEELRAKDSTLVFESERSSLDLVAPAAVDGLEHRLEQVALARRIATQAHRGQVDKLGVDYIQHPRRVAARLDQLDEQAVAWLHDVGEDTAVTEEDLRAAGVDEEVVAAVLLLSRNTGDEAGYFERIAASPLARAVKLADIADNTNPARTALLDEETRDRLAVKYRNARRALRGGGEPMSAQSNDRAAGAMVGMACGDALGAGYEFGPALPDDAEVGMIGGGSFRWEPGEWTDDTSMAVPLLEVAARGDRFEGEALEHVASRWLDWSSDAKDVGTQTRAVFRAARSAGTAEALRTAALDFARTHERSAGNGSLMRTAPVALAYLGDDDESALIDAARRISDLTHADPLAGDACVLWCLAIRHAARTGDLSLRAGLDAIDESRRDGWAERIDEAEAKQPRDFPSNGWAGGALQAAWSAIVRGDDLVDILERAVRGGNDTDTVAAIAGGLAGAVHGASAVPARWRRILHGWPGLDADRLTRMAVLAANGGVSDSKGWPTADRFPPSNIRTLVRHPHDEGVWLGSLAALDDLPEELDAVVSLCRVGTRQTDREQVEFWLIDKPNANPNLDFTLRDAADTVAALRAEGKTVLVHCFEGRSRTPAVGSAYSVLHLGKPADVALREVTAALPEGAPGWYFQDAVHELEKEN